MQAKTRMTHTHTKDEVKAEIFILMLGTHSFAYRGISTTANDHTVILPTSILVSCIHQMAIVSFCLQPYWYLAYTYMPHWHFTYSHIGILPTRGNIPLPNELFGIFTKGQLPNSIFANGTFALLVIFVR